MPWSNQSGGGGGGNRGPWGQGPSSGGQMPPDLEEILKKGQDKLKQAMPGGTMGGRGYALLVVLAVVGWLATGFYQVEPDEQGVVLRFGQYIKTTNPGLNYHLPYPIEAAFTPQVLAEHQENIGFRTRQRGTTVTKTNVPDESLMLSGDQNIVDVQFTVLWVISDANKYLFNLEDQKKTVGIVAEAAMREHVGLSRGEDVRTKKRLEAESTVKELMQKTLDSYDSGILVTGVKLEKADPPPSVIDAFEDVQRAQQDRRKLENEAKSYANKRLGDARGQSAQIVEAAEAYRKQTVAEADGEAQRFISIYNEYKVAKEVTRRRMFLESMEKVLSRSNKVIIEGNAGSGVVPYLPLPEINKRQNAN